MPISALRRGVAAEREPLHHLLADAGDEVHRHVALLVVGLTATDLVVAPASASIAIMGQGAAYTGHCRRPIRMPAFVALNLLSLALIFGQPLVLLIAGGAGLAILAWHVRPERVPGVA